MTISDPRLRSLLRQANKVAEAGKRSAAEQLYRQILDEAPESHKAWIGLAGVLRDQDASEAAYQQALSIQPESQEAKSGLARLRGEAPPAEVEVPVSKDGETSNPFDQSRDWLEQATAKQSDQPAPVQPAVAAPAEPEAVNEQLLEPAVEEAVDESFALVCYRHPKRETALRCYTCERPICSSCAVKTPVGYRCPTCVREAEGVFFTASFIDYLLALLVALPVSLAAGYLVLQLSFSGGFFFILIMVFAGGAVGGLIGRIVHRVIGRRRGRYIPHVVGGAVILGILLPILYYVLLGVPLTVFLLSGIYLLVAPGAAYYQMK